MHPYLCYICVKQNEDNNLNRAFNKSFDDNFNTAMKMCECEYSNAQLVEFLSSSSEIVEKQIAALKLNEIKSFDEATILVSNLVNQDGKIREAVAFKINELIKNPKFTEFFLNKADWDIFMQAIMDINSNVCRQIIEAVGFLRINEHFREYFCPLLLKTISDLFEEADKMDMTDKKYILSKKNFQLYWCLETLFDFAEFLEFSKVREILFRGGEFYDYTIREKIAKILGQGFYNEFSEIAELKEKLKNDGNYYVRRYLSES